LFPPDRIISFADGSGAHAPIIGGKIRSNTD
jgi:hypothetical protein